MNNMKGLGYLLLITGGILAAAGLILILFPKIPFLGKLPGDIIIQKKNFSIHFPVVSCIIISVILSLVFWFFSRK